MFTRPSTSAQKAQLVRILCTPFAAFALVLLPQVVPPIVFQEGEVIASGHECVEAKAASP